MMTYGQAMDLIEANHGTRVQAVDWPAQKWIFVNDFEVVTVHLENGGERFYQQSDGYNLSNDLEKKWRVV